MKPKRKCNAEMTTDQDFVDCPKNSLWGGSDAIFAVRLVDWQRRCGRRDLPWQGNDPYRVWLSEVMLQQTQVRTVLPYFARFVARFPTVEALAAAPLDEVLALWSGLGYYARARHLHAAARLWVARWPRSCPQGAQEWVQLPGVGRSTAAAIAAFAFGARGAILDGNVKRVLCRVFGIEGDPGHRAVEMRLWRLAESLLPASEIGSYIQAQMDLGATLCTRGLPACGRCPLAEICVARREGLQASLPTPRARKLRPRRSSRVAVLCHAGAVLLQRRPLVGLWGGLLTLPEIPADELSVTWAARTLGLSVSPGPQLPPVDHAFTHFQLQILPELLSLTAQLPQPGVPPGGEFAWQPLADLGPAALPAPVRRILKNLPGRA